MKVSSQAISQDGQHGSALLWCYEQLNFHHVCMAFHQLSWGKCFSLAISILVSASDWR